MSYYLMNVVVLVVLVLVVAMLNSKNTRARLHYSSDTADTLHCHCLVRHYTPSLTGLGPVLRDRHDGIHGSLHRGVQKSGDQHSG